jgi:hypothetical protein
MTKALPKPENNLACIAQKLQQKQEVRGQLSGNHFVGLFFKKKNATMLKPELLHVVQTFEYISS